MADRNDREARALRFLEREVWPRIPDDQIGRSLSRDEEDEILGYGPAGTPGRAELLDRVLDEELPRYAEALKRFGQQRST